MASIRLLSLMSADALGWRIVWDQLMPSAADQTVSLIVAYPDVRRRS